MNEAIPVTEGSPVQRHQVHGASASDVAKLLGYGPEACGVSVEPDVVVIHVLSKRNKLTQVRHQIGG